MRTTVARVAKVFVAAVAGVVVLLVAIGFGLWWWAGTQSSLDWTLARIAQSQSITAQGVQGSLRTGLRAQHLQWEHEGLKVEAFDAELAWQPLALWRATVKLDQLHASRLRIEDRRPPQPSAIPVSLELPLRVEIDDVRIGQVQWLASANAFEAADVAGRYSYNMVSHDVRLAGLKWAGGTYSGEAKLGAAGKFPVDAQLQGRFEATVPGAKDKVPLSFTASLGGVISDMQARAELQGAGTTATATARVTPWATQPVPQAQADFRQLDVGALWAQAPRTSLGGRLQLQPAGTGTWTLTADATNAIPGPWNEHKFPVESLKATGEWRAGGVVLVRELHAKAGGGTLDASGQWRGADGWTVDGKLANIDPAAVDTQMAHLPVHGTVRLEGKANNAIDFDVDAKASGTAARGNALELRSVRAQGRWSDGALSLPVLDVRTSDARLQASIDARPQAKSGGGRATLDAPGLQVKAEGKISENAGAGRAEIHGNDLAGAVQWIAKLPGVPKDAAAQIAGGRIDAQMTWQGGWRDPVVQANVGAPILQLRGSAPPWTLRDTLASVNGRLSDAQLQLHAHAEQGQRKVDVDIAGRGGRRGAQANAAWQGQLTSFKGAVTDPSLGGGAWTVTLQRAFDWRWSSGRLEAGAGEALLKSPRGDPPAQLAWEPLRWGGGELRTAGRLSGLPLAWLELLGGPQLAGSAVSGDMVFDAQWDAQLGAAPRIRASLARVRGDVSVLAENAEGATTRVPAGVREARIAIESNGEAVTATLRWDSEHGGTADGRFATRLARGSAAGWQWPADAPINGSLNARLPRIGVWSLLAPPGWRLRGSLVANVNFSGTRADPNLQGTLAADDLALRSVVDGIEMQSGKLRAHLEGRRVLIDEFLLHGPGANGGTLTATGEGAWTSSGPQASMKAELVKLRASIRSDRQVTVSGNIAAKRDASGTAVNGKLQVDQALVVMPDQSTPKLGDDVVVRNAAAPITRKEARAAEESAKPSPDKLQVAIDIDLGDDFRVQGAGVDTRLQGTLALSGQSIASPRLVGIIRANGGEYRAYGQRLEIERGVVRFTGNVENPALDILAVRPNITQRVGVMVTGTALTPYVRLYSEPDLPDAEKLAWLVTGRAAPATGAESALVQQAALALLASRSGGGKQGIAASLGLDELSFRREGGEGPAVTLGKRFGRNFYAAYERSLAGALGTLYIFYDVTQKLTVRGQTGERTAVDLIYTFAFD